MLTSNITTIPDLLKPKHLKGLDGLRGISILIVIFAHFFRKSDLNALYIGSIGVDIFFVISGFLITTLLLKEHVNNGCVSLKHFYIRRILRIMPVAYLFLLILFVLNICLDLNITIANFITSAFYLKNIPIKSSGDWYTGHFWSLSVEEQYYLIFPFLLVYARRQYLYIVFSAIIFIPFVMFFGYTNLGGIQDYRIPHLITFGLINIFGKGTVSILVGSLTAFLTFKKIIDIEKIKVNYFFSFWLFSIGILIETVAFNIYFSPILFASIIAFIILNNLSQRTFFSAIVENKMLAQIGVLSYSLYIWQQLFTNAQPWHDLFPFSGSIIFNLFALFVTAAASYYLFERRFLILKKRFK